MQLSESDRLVHRNDFATRCFREVADKDYIAARTSYRFGLVEPFLWSALRAVEKYLKAILLYNEHTTKSLGHDVEKAYRRVVNISDLRCEFPQTVTQFIRNLGRHASSRYLERPYYTMGCELLKLDLSVWHLRRYCQDLRHEPNKVDKREWLAIMLKSIAVERWEDEPQRFQVPGGFLEKVLKGRRDSELREQRAA